MNSIIRISLALFIFSIMLSACTTIAPPAPSVRVPAKDRQAALNQIQSWQLNGKIAVQTARDSGSATIEWAQNYNRYTISLFGPLGSNSLKLTGQPGVVTMRTSDGKSASASNPEQLLAQQWGWKVPVSNLHYWIRGIAVPGSSGNPHFDDYGRLTQLVQQGYNVQYLGYTKSGSVDLPSKIFITSPAVKVKIIVYQWNVT